MPTTSSRATASPGCARYLGEDVDAPIRHPALRRPASTCACMGVKHPGRRRTTAATIIPSVGCPMGCNFCTTSAFFGGKGKILNFYETGEELFDVMERGGDVARTCSSFFIMDENFLLQRKARAWNCWR